MKLISAIYLNEAQCNRDSKLNGKT